MSLDEGIRLAKQGQYAAALALLDDQWKANGSQFSAWDKFYYGKCLRKTGREAEAVKINKAVYLESPDFTANNTQYAWNLYDLHVKPFVDNEANELERFLRVVEFITQITAQDRYSPYERAVFAVLKRLKDKNNPALTLQWLNKLDPALLTQETFSFDDQAGKSRELASRLEDWHRYRVKSYRAAKDWESCIRAADEALRTIRQFHYDNHLWIRIDRAIATAELGELQDAISQLEAVALESHHWTADRQLFTYYVRMGSVTQALDKAACVMLARSGEPEHKTKLIQELAALLADNGLTEEAELHRRLLVALQKKGAPLEPVDRRQLERLWESWQLASLPQGTGAIAKLIGEGKSGFIQDDAGGQLFFQAREFKGPRNRLAIGQPVRFHIKDSYDRKKQQKSKEAIRISIR